MANTIKIKRNTGSTAPTTSNIAQGELAISESNKILFYRDASDNILKIGGEGAFLRSDQSDTLSGNLTITGNLEVQGDTVTTDVATLQVEDPLIKLAKNNTGSDAVDIGFYGAYDTSGSQDLYAGLFRDANNSGKFSLFTDLQAEPTTTVNKSGTGYTVGTLIANIEGNLAGSPTITAATVATSLDLNGSELILDADADTSITADTDDTIDIKVAGADQFAITDGAITPENTNDIDLGSNTKKFKDIYIDGTAQLDAANVAGSAAMNVADAQTVTGVKTLTTPIFADNTDATKKASFVISGISTNTTRTFTMPDATTTIVGTDATQTLTNKTLTTPTIGQIQGGGNNTSGHTVPNLADDTFALLAASQTFTNKVIDSGTY
jgi:hypothetical protein|tara:strand:- start:742 stop:1881 length:1140 start_codon:yes stop_codon:yes gene_type:complete